MEKEKAEMTLYCRQCGKAFTVLIPFVGKLPVVCSDECRRERTRQEAQKYRQEHKKPGLSESICEYCGKTYQPRRGAQRYCCKECGRLASKSTLLEHKKTAKKKPDSFDDIQEQIEQHYKETGRVLSYGQWVAGIR